VLMASGAGDAHPAATAEAIHSIGTGPRGHALRTGGSPQGLPLVISRTLIP
jgi:hypothetical protein